MIIHDRFVFAHCPRTGGTFIEQFLKDNVPGARDSTEVDGVAKHHRIASLFSNGSLCKTFTFGVVRNPLDYYVSVWHFEKRDYRSKAIGNSYVMADGARDDFKVFVRQLMALNRNPGKDLWDFDSMSRLGIGLATWRFLYSFCNARYLSLPRPWSADDLLMLDHVIRFEQLKADFYVMLQGNDGVFQLTQKQLNGLLFKSPVNVSHDRGDWLSYYDDDLMELVRHKDAFLFDNFYSYI